MQPRFADFDLPPESNANFAFILTALDKISDKAVFLLPCGVLTTENDAEFAIRESLVRNNLIEAVIACPQNMFESTSIPTCILVFSKVKTTTDVMFVDMRDTHGEEERRQNGQFGGNSHENRTYVKTVNVFRSEDMEKALLAIKNLSSIPAFSRRVSPEVIAENRCVLTPSRYIEFEAETVKRRNIADVVSDINRIVAEKNAVKITVNESLSRQLGLREVFDGLELSAQNSTILNETLKTFGCSINDGNYISLSKRKNEFSFANESKEFVSSILMMVLPMWKSHIHYLNNEENRYLIELRDILLEQLMKPRVSTDETGNTKGEST